MSAVVRHVGERVRIDVAAPRARGLTLESGREHRLRLVLEDRPIAWGRAVPWGRGIGWVRGPRSAPLSIVAPIRAKDARAHTELGEWPARLADALVRSERAPLRPGTWELVALTPRAPSDWEALRGIVPDDLVAPESRPWNARALGKTLDRPAATFVAWITSGAGIVLPLRAASAEDAARVKSFRKLAREGALPPVLLWWVDALDGYLLLDGHDRLLAARLEGVRPRAVALYGVRDEPADPAWGEAAIARYERVFASEAKLASGTRLRENERLVRAFRGDRRTWTPAVARTDLATRFAAELPELEEELKAVM